MSITWNKTGSEGLVRHRQRYPGCERIQTFRQPEHELVNIENEIVLRQSGLVFQGLADFTAGFSSDQYTFNFLVGK